MLILIFLRSAMTFQFKNKFKTNRTNMKKVLIPKLRSLFILTSGILLNVNMVSAQKLQVNDPGYLETQGLNVFVFNNEYNGFFFDEKTAGIELIHHGVRTSTGGAVRLQSTPEQWDLVPTLIERKVNKADNSIDVVLRYEAYDFISKIHVSSMDNGFMITVILDKPLPESLKGHAGFNMEFLPASYFEKSFLADGKPGNFPMYPASNTLTKNSAERIPQFAYHNTFDDRGRNEFIDPLPMATGKTIVLAPEDPERFIKIESQTELMLFDGRNLAQNGWFVVRSLLPSKKTGNVLQWFVKPNVIPNWVRTPVMSFSQAGYVPQQEKVAVIELDKKDTPLTSATLFQVSADGKIIEKLSAATKPWGAFLRYNYIKFDFSTVQDPGLYFIQYGNQKTNTFAIDAGVY